MTASAQLIDPDALVDVSNYSSLETCVIRPCQSLCNSHSSPRLQPVTRSCMQAHVRTSPTRVRWWRRRIRGGDNRSSGSTSGRLSLSLKLYHSRCLHDLTTSGTQVSPLCWPRHWSAVPRGSLEHLLDFPGTYFWSDSKARRFLGEVEVKTNL